MISTLFALLFLFQNCAGGLPGEIQVSEAGSVSAPAGIDPLSTDPSADPSVDNAVPVNSAPGTPADLRLSPTQSASAANVWIGASACPTCLAAGNKKYRIGFKDLKPGTLYSAVIRTASHVGDKPFIAKAVSGSMEVLTGQKRLFADQGVTAQARDLWIIDFRASSAETVIEIGNAAAAGTNAYLYLKSVSLNEKAHSVPESSLVQVGAANHTGVAAVDSAEFLSADANPFHEFGSGNYATVRPWIGISNCPGCPAGSTFQSLVFRNLVPGTTYNLTVHFSALETQSNFFAQVTSGSATTFTGSIKNNYKNGPARNSDQWIMEFTPGTTALTILLGLAPVAPNYAYIDFYRLTKKNVGFQSYGPLQLSNWIKARDTYNNGLWYAGEVNNYAGGRYAWAQAYVMQAYLDAYKMTGDIYWIEKLVRHSDLVLSQRDSVTGRQDYRGRSGPVWQEPATRYAWAGFSAAMFMPMVELGRLVAENEALTTRFLADGRSLNTVSQQYLMKYAEVLSFYEEDWFENSTEGYYRFPADLTATGITGAEPLAGQALAFDFGGLLAINHMNLAAYYQLVGNPSASALYRGRAQKFARFFRRQLQAKTVGGLPGIVWPFSTYYSGVDDIGHGNLNVRFFLKAYQGNLEFTASDLLGIANTYQGLLYSNGDIGATLIDGTDSTSFGLNNSTFYYHGLACFSPSLRPLVSRVLDYHGSDFIGVLDLAHGLTNCAP